MEISFVTVQESHRYKLDKSTFFLPCLFCFIRSWGDILLSMVLWKDHVYIWTSNTEQFRLTGTSEGYLLRAGQTSELDQVALGLILRIFKYLKGVCQQLTALTLNTLFKYIQLWLSHNCCVSSLFTLVLLLVSEQSLVLPSPSTMLCTPASQLAPASSSWDLPRAK